MAYIKNKNQAAPTEEIAVQELENLEETKETTIDTEIEEETPTTEAEPKAKKAKDKADKEIPANILDTLKIFSNLKAVYVNSKGAVFSVDTPEVIRGNAVLYKNPYFKS